MKIRLKWCSTILLLIVLLIAAISCSSAPTLVPVPTTPTTPTMNVTPNTPREQVTIGNLSNINGNTLTLNTTQGPVTISVGSDTTIQKTDTGTLTDIHEGAFIIASGNQDANGNIIATSIRIQPELQNIPSIQPTRTPRSRAGINPPSQRQGAMGAVTKIDDNALTLDTAQGPVVVNTDSNTAIQMTIKGSLQDFKEGESLFVMGNQDENGNISATSIRIQPEGQNAMIPPSI